MDRTHMLRNLVMLTADEGDSSGLGPVGTCAGVRSATSRELATLWMDTVHEHPWLVPEPVREFDYDHFSAWFLSSLDAFALGYMLAGREALETPPVGTPSLS